MVNKKANECLMYSSRYDSAFYSNNLGMDSSTPIKLDGASSTKAHNQATKNKPKQNSSDAKYPVVQTTILNVKNKLLCDLTRAIQLVKNYFCIEIIVRFKEKDSNLDSKDISGERKWNRAHDQQRLPSPRALSAIWLFVPLWVFNIFFCKIDANSFKDSK